MMLMKSWNALGWHWYLCMSSVHLVPVFHITQMFLCSLQLNYTSCACIVPNVTMSPEVTAVPLATSGPCPQPCLAFIPFMVLLFAMTLVVSITQMPLLMIILRYVLLVFFHHLLFPKMFESNKENAQHLLTAFSTQGMQSITVVCRSWFVGSNGIVVVVIVFI